MDDILLTVTSFLFFDKHFREWKLQGASGSKAKSASALHGGWIFSGTTHTVLFCNLACMPWHPLFPLLHAIKGICNKGNQTSACRLFKKKQFPSSETGYYKRWQVFNHIWQRWEDTRELLSELLQHPLILPWKSGVSTCM